TFTYVPTFKLLTSLPAPTEVSFGCTGLNVVADYSETHIQGIVTLVYNRPPRQQYPGPIKYNFTLPSGDTAFHLLDSSKTKAWIKGEPLGIAVSLVGDLTLAVVNTYPNICATNVTIRCRINFLYSKYQVEAVEYTLDSQGEMVLPE